jgi:phytoene dehydrogenase-like protein
MTSSYDTIILGSSPNALTAAAYLARGGKRVLVLEPSERIGGAVSTAEFADGFKGDTGLTSGRLDADIIKDLKLHEHGLEVIERDTITSLLPGGRSFTLPAARDAATEVIRAFAPKDAARYLPFVQLVDLASDFLRCAYAMTPPAQHPPSDADVQQMTALVGRLRGYGRREMTEVMRLLVMSARHLLDEWFESAELKGLLGAAAIRGLNQGPFAGSTTFNLLHHMAIGDGYFRATAKGGIGAISEALSKAATAYGVEIRTKCGAGTFRVNVSDGVATGVQIDGETIEAATIISDYDARHTFTNLVPPPELEPEFNRAVKNIRYKGSVARINLALSELPKFKGVADEALRGTLTLAPSLEYIERAFDGGKYGDISKQPFLEVTMPSISDDSLAPAGKHVMSIWLQYAPYRGEVGAEQVCGTAMEALSEFVPNLKSIVHASQVITPSDYETRFHLFEGHLYGGEMNLAQAFFLRPLPGFAQYQTPISHLYLCGAATHPGGGVHGLCGRNSARELGVRDLVPV